MKVKTSINEDNSLKVAVTVSDTGIGICENDVENLFKPYFKTSDKKSKSLNASSHGLGLSIC